MQIYLPIAEMSVPVETFLLLGVFVGFLSGIFGIGGGFLTTPFLIFSGIPPVVAVGTQASQMVASSVAGVLGHWDKGNVDVKMGFVMMAGGFFGSIVGILIFNLLEKLGQIDLAISILYIMMLGFIGTLMLTESFLHFMKPKSMRKEFNTLNVNSFVNSLPYKMRFPRSKLYISALVPGGIGFIGGILAAVMGVGAGFMIVPAMIYILGMPSLLVAGTSLFQMIFATAFATMMHALMNNTVDIVLAVILIIGSVAGAQVGIVFARHVRGIYARVTLALIVLAVCLQMIGSLFITPEEIYSTVVLS
jgi:uncharacterized membrane protein YfcA